MKRIAVIGAGLTGTVTALGLSEAGIQVDLYDRNSAPLLGASGVNEGKIHHGYVYAMDRSFKTAQTMLRGAACFRTILERWVSSDVFERHISAPFNYAVPHSSMLDLGEIRAHFSQVSQVAQGFAPKSMRDHEAGVRELSDLELNNIFDPEHVAACFETTEIAIDPLALRTALIPALTAVARIVQRYSTEISSIRESGAGYVVTGKDEHGPISEQYDAVVNATWHQRLKLDASFGIQPSRQAIHRYKCGLRTTDPLVAKNLPSVTFVVGEYGDTVAYGGNAYASWYPTGLISQEIGQSPANDDVQLSPAQQRDITDSTLHNLLQLMPGAAGALRGTSSKWDVVGGYISAWGKTGIDHTDSELHDRYDIGIHSNRGYHSIDTGKYTLAPLFATEVVDRILT